MAANGPLAAMQLIQGVVDANTLYNQSKQIRYNARVAEANIFNNINTMIVNRKANARREVNIGTRRLAQIENSFAKSGIEMRGDVVNYMAEIAGVQELDIQQRNQDMFYQTEVMKVQSENMRMAAKQQEKALKMSAITSLIGAGAKAGVTQSESVSFWQKYGVSTGSTTQTQSVNVPNPKLFGGE